MKKFSRVLVTLTLLCLSLTACRINWFDRHYDVPWWIIAVPVAIVTVVVWGIAVWWIARKTYTCPSCRHDFRPKWQQCVFSLHINDDRLFKCPRCRKRHFCRPTHD